eukprot:1230622-Rhodomonas_salina.1
MVLRGGEEAHRLALAARRYSTELGHVPCSIRLDHLTCLDLTKACLHSLSPCCYLWPYNAAIYGRNTANYGFSTAMYGDSAAVYGHGVAIYGGSAAIYGRTSTIYGGSAAIYGRTCT